MFNFETLNDPLSPLNQIRSELGIAAIFLFASAPFPLLKQKIAS